MNDADTQMHLFGAISTAPDPPCFAYLVFKSPRDTKGRHLQIVQKNRVIGFQPVMQPNIVRLKRSLTTSTGKPALFCFKMSKGNYFIATHAAMQDYIRDILTTKKADHCPVFKRSLHHFVGDDSKIEQDNCDIIEKYKDRRPASTKYFVLNDVLRGHISNQISAEVRPILSMVRILQDGTSFDVEYPTNADIHAKQAIDLALKATVEKSPALKKFMLPPEETANHASKHWPAYESITFDFPYDRHFISKIANTKSFVAIGYDEPPLRRKKNSYKEGLFEIFPTRLSRFWTKDDPTTLERALEFASAHTLENKTKMQFRDAKLGILVWYFSINPNVESFVKKARPLHANDILRLAISSALPLPIIISILLENLPKSEYERLHRFIDVGANRPPKELHSNVYLKILSSAPQLDDELVRRVKIELKV